MNSCKGLALIALLFIFLVASNSVAGQNQQPQCFPLSQGLLGWWSGDNNAEDLLNQNHGFFKGPESYTNGIVAKAFTFNGINSYVSIPDQSRWAFGHHDFSIILWVNFHSTNRRVMLIGSDEGAYESGNKWLLEYHLPNRTIEFLFHTPQFWTRIPLKVPFAPETNQWYHFAVTREGTRFRLFINGIPSGIGEDTNPIPDARSPLTIGWAEWNYYFHGLIDEVAIYGRALSSREIDSIYRSGSAGMCKGPEIIVPPQDQFFVPGTNITFSVTVDAPDSTSYQWQFNEINIAGGTNSTLLLENVNTNQLGRYSVTLSNETGLFRKASALLTPVRANLTLLPSVRVDGLPGLRYQIWYSESLDNPTNWVPLEQVTLTTNSFFYIDHSGIGKPRRFYWVSPTL